MTQFVCLLVRITSTSTPWSLLRQNREFTGRISSTSKPRVYESQANISTVCQGPFTVTDLTNYVNELFSEGWTE